jgi:hypothetical protein
VCFVAAEAQKRAPAAKYRTQPAAKKQNTADAVVIDETLSVLRSRPSLFATPVQRIRRGRRVRILGTVDADGVKFYKVTSATGRSGWIQSDALFGRFRAGDEERFARLVQAAGGFEQIDLANAFFAMYPSSRFRPPILLLFGDLLENSAAKLSRDAASRLSRLEMAASGAPTHSYYLNFNMLDRYRRLGVTFLFNPTTRAFHYDGSSWTEILRKYPTAPEAAEARKRLDSLRAKLEAAS